MIGPLTAPAKESRTDEAGTHEARASGHDFTTSPP